MVADAPGVRPGVQGSTAACGAEAAAVSAVATGRAVTFGRAGRSTAHGGYYADTCAADRPIRDHPGWGLLQPAHVPRRRGGERCERIPPRSEERATLGKRAQLPAQSAVFRQRAAQQARGNRRL